MTDSPYFDVRAAATYVHLSWRTLEAMRSAGTGPRYAKLGARRIVYSRADLDAWVASHMVAPSTSAAK